VISKFDSIIKSMLFWPSIPVESSIILNSRW
jgi:hypothetical protein